MVSNGGHMVSNRGHMVSNGGHVVSSNNRGSHMGSSNVVSSRISHTMVASKSSIASISHNIGISLSFSLGHMNNASRVSDIAAGSSIESSYSRDSSRGSTSSGEGGRGGHLGVASGNVVSCRYNRGHMVSTHNRGSSYMASSNNRGSSSHNRVSHMVSR